MFSPDRSWSPAINWDAPAGRTLRKLIEALPAEHEFVIGLFGSAPLQLGLDPGFVSGDMDLFCEPPVEEFVRAARLDKESSPELYVQCCVEGNFRTSPRWRTRACQLRIANCTVTIPHPIDILIAKLHRCDDKDLRAFRLVIERTGHPTEDELRRELQVAVDLYRPNFDEEMSSDITTGTRLMWNEIFGHDIDVRREIIAPALARRREGYADDVARADYKAELRRLGGAE